VSWNRDFLKNLWRLFADAFVAPRRHINGYDSSSRLGLGENTPDLFQEITVPGH
jgi:hypothetical protein